LQSNVGFSLIGARAAGLRQRHGDNILQFGYASSIYGLVHEAQLYDMEEPFDDDPLPPSKSLRKREAHGLQKLGEHLVGMRDKEFRTLPLPDSLIEAILEARRLKSRAALARQYQYIGRLMREIDIGPLEQALTALTDRHNAHARLRK
jgi:ribosomal 50S subunit-associated protein YjgA (DUF615 family)